MTKIYDFDFASVTQDSLYSKKIINNRINSNNCKITGRCNENNSKADIYNVLKIFYHRCINVLSSYKNYKIQWNTGISMFYFILM